MSNFELLAKASGCRIYGKDDLVLVKEQPASWIPTARFVLLLISGIPLIFGVVSLFTHFQGYETSLTMSIIFIAVGSVFAFAYVFLNKYSKKINALPPSEFRTLCSFDLKNKVLLDSSGKELDSLNNVSVGCEFQITSSSKKLVVRYSSGTILLAKGNPFAGGTAALEAVFKQLGLMK
ncbi:MAG: hypothetical protein P8P74_03105 [Crocinitomicaceae bacterium]|nr:hypothetical protein [Crocinitomicaceae bacterium]